MDLDRDPGSGWSCELGTERLSFTRPLARAMATTQRRSDDETRSRKTDMEPTDPYTQLSPEAVSIVDQLVDIAHDEGSREAAAIEWYTPDEEPPLEALEELQKVGICRHYRENESVIVSFTPNSGSRYC